MSRGRFDISLKATSRAGTVVCLPSFQWCLVISISLDIRAGGYTVGDCIRLCMQPFSVAHALPFFHCSAQYSK